MIEVLGTAALAVGLVLFVRSLLTQRARDRHMQRVKVVPILPKRNDGKHIDARLPDEAVVRDRRLSKRRGQYDPNVRQVRLDNENNRRREMHEKGHVIWDLRMSKQQRQEFRELAIQQGWAPTRKVNGYRAEEELFSIMFAGYKEKRRFSKPAKKFFDKLVRQ